MESNRRGLVVLLAVAAMLIMLFAGQCHSAPSSTDATKSRRRHKMNLGVCSPLCFVQCAMDGYDLMCFGQCILQCIPMKGGKPDPNNPRDICLVNCAVPGCAKLCTKDHPFPRKEVRDCLQTCSDNCDENEATYKMQSHD
ncbi:hypothetical protein LINPERPRIM_LOCUS38579 [Linum perenne]